MRRKLWHGGRTAAVCAAALWICGCSAWGVVTRSPEGADAVKPAQAPGAGPALSASLDAVREMWNGWPAGVSPKFRKRAIEKLQETGLFQAVKDDAPAAEKLVRITFDVKERFRPHSGANAIKAFFGAVTFFILSPLLPMTYDFESDMTMAVERLDGQTKCYTAKAAGLAKVHLLALPKRKKGFDDAARVVTDANLNALMNQMLANSDWLRQGASE